MPYQLCHEASAPRHLNSANVNPTRRIAGSIKTPLHSQPRLSSTRSPQHRPGASPVASSREAEAAYSYFSSPYQQLQALERTPDHIEEISTDAPSSAEASSRAHVQEAEPPVVADSFFSGPFQQALSQALERTPDLIEEISAVAPSSAPASSRAHVREAEPPAVADSFFSSPFQEALSKALERSPDLIQEIGIDAPSIAHAPVAIPGLPSASVPKLPPPPPPSAQEDMLGAALEASKTSLNRLMVIRNELDRAIDRERMQVERLTFAVDKAQKDEAYYRVLRVMQERGNSDLDE